MQGRDEQHHRNLRSLRLYTYIRQAIDCVTRKWHTSSVETPADFEAMKKRYNPDAPERYPTNWPERVAALRPCTFPTTLSVPGLFWPLREWCGLEPLCVLALDDPDGVRKMVAFWTESVSQALAWVWDAGILDIPHISEDRAYKEHSMISQALARAFLLPAWKRWATEARRAGLRPLRATAQRIDGLAVWRPPAAGEACRSARF